MSHMLGCWGEPLGMPWGSRRSLQRWTSKRCPGFLESSREDHGSLGLFGMEIFSKFLWPMEGQAIPDGSDCIIQSKNNGGIECHIFWGREAICTESSWQLMIEAWGYHFETLGKRIQRSLQSEECLPLGSEGLKGGDQANWCNSWTDFKSLYKGFKGNYKQFGFFNTCYV